MEETQKVAIRLNLVGKTFVGAVCRGSYLELSLDSSTLTIGSAWRLTCSGELVLGSDSAEEVIDSLPKFVLNKVIVRSEVNSKFNDLTVDLGGELMLETFANSECYESWTLSCESGEMLISGPGRLWSHFPQIE